MNNRPAWRSAFRTAVFVHAAIVAAIFLYAVIIEILKAMLRPLPRLAPETDVRLLRYVFYGLAIVAVVVIRRVNRGAALARPDEPYRDFLQRLSRTAIISSTLCEAPAGLGLVLMLLTGSVRDFYYLLFVSLFLAFMYFPRTRAWEEISRRQYPQAEP